jgi:hypothetical protein
MDQDKLVEMTKVHVSTMLSIADALGGVVSQDEVRKVAMVKLSPTAIRAASLLANVMLVDLECVTLAIAGLSDDAALEALLAGLQVPQITPSMLPADNPRAAAIVPADQVLEGDSYA